MKSYIKDIVIFNKNGEKRVVPLEQGVNIITGESKTGKSALVEIIDYCLCSTRCTIPKGKITEFAYLYSLVMAIGDNTYVIARYNWNDGGKMHFIKEKEDFELEKLELSYFMEKSQLLCKDVKDEIEYALGLLITNMAKDAEQQGKKASLRNMVSYLFQHQNLMASKFALFYRFSDFYKRKDVIDQFPVFAGMISQEYYSDLIQLNTLKDQLKQKYKKQKANEKSTAYIKERLSTLLLQSNVTYSKFVNCNFSNIKMEGDLSFIGLEFQGGKIDNFNFYGNQIMQNIFLDLQIKDMNLNCAFIENRMERIDFKGTKISGYCRDNIFIECEPNGIMP